MALQFRKKSRQYLDKQPAEIRDNTPNSDEYFGVIDFPNYLGEGKNSFRIKPKPGSLLPNSRIDIEVLDRNGNPIYYEIPNYTQSDKSRLVSIYIYDGVDEDYETPTGTARVIIRGTSPDGRSIVWSRNVEVNTSLSSNSTLLFNSTSLPQGSVSSSVQTFVNISQTDGELRLTSQSSDVRYIKSIYGEDVSFEVEDSSLLNGEMVGGSIEIDFSSTTLFPRLGGGQSQPNIYTGSITEVVTNKILRVSAPITQSDARSNGSIHTYESSNAVSSTIRYYSTASNSTTQNQVAFANVTLTNVDPIVGRVHSVNTLIKSQGLPGAEFELISNNVVSNESTIEYSVPIPTEHLNDPKTIKIQFVNVDGFISPTEVIVNNIIFTGGNVYIGGNQSIVTGSLFISNAIGSGLEIGGHSSGFLKSVGYEGQTSASSGQGPGGFIIYSGSGGLQMGADVLQGVGLQFVGDNDDRHLIFTTHNGGLLDIKTDKFFIGTDSTQFISGSGGNIEISSSLFHLDPLNEVLVIGADAIIEADLSANNIRTPATIGGVQSTDLNASSSIKSDGFARFVSASIGGWDITTASIEGGNLIMKPDGTLQTKDYASDLKGWIITSANNGYAEFENIKIRGTLATTTFEKESVNAVGGQLYVANSTTLSGSYSSSLETTTSTGVTSSTTLPSQLGNNASDYLEYNSSDYSISSVDSGTEFTIASPIYADSDSATLHYSQSNSFSSQVRAYEVKSVQSAFSASLSNRNAITAGDGNFDIQNLTLINGGSINDFQNNTFTISEAGGNSIFQSGGTRVTGAFFSQWGGPYTIELNGDVFNQNITTTRTFYIYFSSASNQQVSTNQVTKNSGTWPDAIENDGEITFNDGAGSRTYDILEKASSTVLKIDTSSYAPNTSGSNVVATGAYSSSNSSAVTITAGTASSAEYFYTSVSPTSSRLIVGNVTGFAQDEILTVKKVSNTGFTTEYIQVVSSSRLNGGSDTDLSGILDVTRGYGNGTTGDTASLGDIASTAQSYEEGQVIVSTGKIGSGFIRLNANPNDTSTPYMDIVERTGSGLYDIELKARLGDLSGLANTDLVHGRSNPGFGLATDNVYLQGGIIATFGEIGGFGISSTTISSSNNNLILRDSGQITGSTVLIDGGKISGSGVTIDVEDFSLDSTNFKVTTNGDITASNALLDGGTIGGFELGSDIISSSNGSLILRANGHISASEVNLTGDITAELGRFDDISIVGTIAQQNYDSEYLLETWVTSSTIIDTTYAYGGSNAVSIDTVGSSFANGAWTWTVGSGSNATNWSSTYYTASRYLTSVHSGEVTSRPPTFKRWVDIKGGATGFNSSGTPIGYPEEYGSTDSAVESVLFDIPNSGGIVNSFWIRSQTIDVGNLVYSGNINGLILQTAIKFGPAFGGFGPTLRVHILKNDNSVLKQIDFTSRNGQEWIPVTVPLTDALIDTTSTSVNIISQFKIKFEWYIQDTGAGGGTALNYIRFGEVRVIKTPSVEGLLLKGVQFPNSSLSPIRDGTAHYGDLVPGKDNTFDLGSVQTPTNGIPNRRWDDIYATNGTIQTSDETQKTNITSSDLGLSFVNELRPVSYRWVGKSRTHYGLIAQEVSSSLSVFGKTTHDFAGITTGSLMGLRYSELISPMIKAIQELSDEVNQLKLELSQSKG